MISDSHLPSVEMDIDVSPIENVVGHALRRPDRTDRITRSCPLEHWDVCKDGGVRQEPQICFPSQDAPNTYRPSGEDTMMFAGYL